MEYLYLDNKDFSAFNTEHKIWLLYAVLSTVFWIWAGRKAPTAQQKRRVALIMGLIGVVAWAYSVIVMGVTHQVKAQSVIPLHLCYFLNLFLPYMFWKNRLDWLDWAYPIIMAGCLQALFTPDLSQRFPHYYNVRYWLVHTALVQHVFYAIFVYQFRPTFRGVLKCALAINVYAICLAPVNWLLNTNFLYLREPAAGSLMTVLGPWPWYLVAIEGLMLVFFTVVYLPFLRIKNQDAPTTA